MHHSSDGRGPALGERPWDLLVVGGGTAGIVASRTAASFGARVLLVERARTGGDCLWTGCVPSKALLAAASRAADARDAARLGIDVGPVTVDFGRVMEHVRSAITAIEPDDSPATLRAAGVVVEAGDLTFTGRHSAEVDGRHVAFRQAAVCTGSAPTTTVLDDVGEVAPLTSETVWELGTLPGRLAVVGGGAIGCELAQGFARLGAEVTLVEAADRLLAGEDPDASRIVEAALTQDGVSVRTSCRVVDATSTPDGRVLVLSDGTTTACDEVLVSTGRRARTDGLGLEAAGVEVDADGSVVVDAHLRTSNPDVWAAGDVTPHPKYTHVAGVHGSLVAMNAVLGLRRSADTAAVPRVTFTDPEVAAVGAPTGGEQPSGRRVVTRWHHEADRAVCEGRTEGLTRLVVDARDRVVGATVVGPRAGETLGELSLAVARGATTAELTGVTHAYPTFTDPVWNVAIDAYRARLQRPVPGSALRLLVGARRRWVDSSLRQRVAVRSHGEGLSAPDARPAAADAVPLEDDEMRVWLYRDDAPH